MDNEVCAERLFKLFDMIRMSFVWFEVFMSQSQSTAMFMTGLEKSACPLAMVSALCCKTSRKDH